MIILLKDLIEGYKLKRNNQFRWITWKTWGKDGIQWNSHHTGTQLWSVCLGNFIWKNNCNCLSKQKQQYNTIPGRPGNQGPQGIDKIQQRPLMIPHFSIGLMPIQQTLTTSTVDILIKAWYESGKRIIWAYKSETNRQWEQGPKSTENNVMPYWYHEKK